MALVGVERRVGVDVVLRRPAMKVDDRRLRHVRVKRQKLVADDADEVESVVGPAADHTNALFELEDGLKAEADVIL